MKPITIDDMKTLWELARTTPYSFTDIKWLYENSHDITETIFYLNMAQKTGLSFYNITRVTMYREDEFEIDIEYTDGEKETIKL